MNCPKCNHKMLEFPICEEHKKILSYFLCIDCVPYVRIVRHCKFRQSKMIGGWAHLWCTKGDHECDVESDAKTGYVYCPQIREWQEQQADWVKGQNRDFEEKHKRDRNT